MRDYVSIRHQKVQSALTTKPEMWCQDFSSLDEEEEEEEEAFSAQKAPVCWLVSKNCDTENQEIVLFKRSPGIN